MFNNLTYTIMKTSSLTLTQAISKNRAKRAAAKNFYDCLSSYLSLNGIDIEVSFNDYVKPAIVAFHCNDISLVPNYLLSFPDSIMIDNVDNHILFCFNLIDLSLCEKYV